MHISPLVHPTAIRVLVACEYSGKVREAFRKRGFNAISCDLLSPDDGSQDHYTGDLFDAFERFKPHAVVAFPPCTYLTGAGLHWNKRRPERAARTEDALAFVNRIWSLPVDFMAIENPVGCLSTRFMPPSQIIQPYQFGADASKKTCLWLRGFSPLPIDQNERRAGRMVTLPSGKVVERWSNQTDSGQNRLPPTADRWKIRSETYQGVADAMAINWGWDLVGHHVLSEDAA